MNKRQSKSTFDKPVAGLSKAQGASQEPKARGLTSNTALGGMLLVVSGLFLFVYMLRHEDDFVFFAEWAALGLYFLAPLGVILIFVGMFLPTSGRLTKLIEHAKERIRQGAGEYNGHPIPLGKVLVRKDNNGSLLPYPYLAEGGEQPKNFGITFPASTLGFLAYCYFAYYSIVNVHSYSGLVVFVGLPAAIALYILFCLKPFIQTWGMNRREPEPGPSQKAFFADIGRVIRSLQSCTLTQAVSAARLCSVEQRGALIDKLFEDRSTTLHIPLKVRVSNTRHRFQFDVLRGLRLMTPLDREMLRAVLHLYNSDYLSDEDYKYFLGTILAADGQGSIQNYREKISSLDVKEKEMPLAQLKTDSSRAFYVIQNELGWRHNEALSDVLQVVDELVGKFPTDPTVKKVYDMIHHGGKWLASADIPGSNYENLNNSKYALHLGTLEDGTPLSFSQDGSLITVGGAGTGKTQCLVIPNLLNWAGPSIVLDVKPELWEKTAGYRAKTFGPVYKLDFTNEASQKFNPFEFISDDPQQVFADSLFFANLIIPPSVNAGGNQKFWEDSARNVIQACLIALITERTEAIKASGADKPPAIKLTELVRMIVNRDDLEDALETLSCSDIELCRLLGQSIDSMLIQPEKNGSNVLSSVLSQLWTQIQPLVNPRIEEMTKSCDWTPDSLRQANATLYLSLAPGQVAEYAALLRLILGVHLREYLSLSEPEAKKRAPILLMFDEMPQLGYMQAIEQAVETGRSKGIKLWGFVQRLGQLAEQYKDARGFLGNCKAQIYLSPSTEDGTAQMVSDSLGMKQDLADGRKVPLVEPAALAGAEFKDKAIVTGQGSNPAKVSRDWAYLKEEYQQRMRILPPT